MARRTAKSAKVDVLPSADIEKALVTVPAPKKPLSFFVVGAGGEKEVRVDPSKRERYSVFYEMYRQHPTVRAGVEKIAKVAVANGYRFVPEDAEVEPSKEALRSLKSFFRRSNASQLLRLTYKDLLIYGEAYWLIVGAKGGGKPQKAMRLHPMYMDHASGGGQVTGWRYGPLAQTEKAIEYELGEVVHFKLDDPNSDVYGLSPLDSLQHTVSSDLFAMKFNRKFFENSAHTGLIFVVKGSSGDEVARNREWLDQNYVGTDNSHKPLVIEGDVDVKSSVSKMQEMQFVELRKFSRQEILSVLDIDPSKLGINEDVNRSSAKEADNSFRQETVSPLQLIVEEEINNTLILTMFKIEDILFRQEESSMRDKLDLMKMFAEGERMGVFSVNDIRKELGRPVVEGGDAYSIQTAAGLIPLTLVDDVANRLIPADALSGVGAGQPAPVEPSESEQETKNTDD